MPELHAFRIDDGESYWYIAETPEEAIGMYNKDCEESLKGLDIPWSAKPEIVQEEDSDRCAVKMANRAKKGRKIEEIRVVYITESEVEEDDLNILKKCVVRTYGEWIQLKGKGFFAFKTDMEMTG